MVSSTTRVLANDPEFLALVHLKRRVSDSLMAVTFLAMGLMFDTTSLPHILMLASLIVGIVVALIKPEPDAAEKFESTLLRSYAGVGSE